MKSLFVSEEFLKLEETYPFLRRAKEVVAGLKAIDLVILDTETTGLDPASDEIIEVTAFKIVKGEIADVFSELINIGKPLPEEITRLTSITDEMLSDAKDKRSVLVGLVDFIQELPIIAYNAEFDLSFLKRHLKEGINFDVRNPVVCALKLCRRFLPGLGSYKLGNVAGRMNIPTPQTHRSTGDVEITYQLWLKLVPILEEHGATSLDVLLRAAV